MLQNILSHSDANQLIKIHQQELKRSQKIRRLKYWFVSKLFAESGMGIWRGWDLKI